MKDIIEWLEKERDYHKAKENESTTKWDRGYHAGIHTEIGRIIIEARKLEKETEKGE